MSKKILRVNMDELEAEFEDVPEEYENLGGRALTSTIVADEVPPTCDPLGPHNKLVLAPGIVTGTTAPSSGRISAGGKSPLTGGIKESNAGTSFSQTLAKLGIKAIVVEGQHEDGYKLLKVDADGVTFEDAEKWTDRGLYKVYEEMKKYYGDEMDICGVGIAAEMKGSNSGIVFNDPEGRSTRYSGRGGLGAVMATRGLKFILADTESAGGRAPSTGEDTPGLEIKDKETFEKGRKKLVEAIREHDVTSETLPTLGTDSMVNVINEAGGLPQYNFFSGREDEASKVSGEEKAEEIKKRGAVRPHNCSPGCIINCSEIWTKPDGSDPVGILEYESVWALGPNCGIYDLETIGELNRKCNDIGLDTIETGVTLGVAMEGGVADFGDGKAALKLMEEIREGTPLGRILVNGAKFTGKAFGVDRVPEVKGQAMPAYEPRAIKGIGVTYATTPMGADHTAGYTVSPEILGVGGDEDPLSPEGKAELSRGAQKSTAFVDSSGYCLFVTFATADIEKGMEGLVETVNGVLGTDWTIEDAVEFGGEILKKEREFNEKAGLNETDDRVPEFMKEEKLPPHNQTFDVSDEELDKVFEGL